MGVSARNNEAPWIAAEGQFVAVAWTAAESGDNPDVYVAISRNGGDSFDAPVRVNREPGEVYVSGELPPRVALAPSTAGADPDVVVAWTAKVLDTDIRLARSRDGGRTFGTPETLQRPGAAGDRGWHALAIDSSGRAHVIWLDHRGLAEDGEAGHVHAGARSRAPARMDPLAESVAMAQRSGLYYNTEGTDGARERELAKGVCYCCKTALATGPRGAVYAAWRHVYAGSIRDIAFLSSSDGGRTFNRPGRVSDDGWQLDGCPDDGPAMSVDRTGRVHVVWPTVLDGAEPEGAIFYAASSDGRTFGPRVRVPTLGSPKPGHPQIVVDGEGRIAVAWDELQGGVRKVAFRSFTLDNAGRATFTPILTLNTGASGSYPVLASSARGILAVWTAGTAPDGRIAFRRVD